MSFLERTYFSADRVELDGVDVTMSDHFVAMPEFMNAHDHPGVPPHELKLRVGDICRPAKDFGALAQHTRCIVRQLRRDIVAVSPMPVHNGHAVR
jgi:hypothetical protein